jgi:hypothetical protein
VGQIGYLGKSRSWFFFFFSFFFLLFLRRTRSQREDFVGRDQSRIAGFCREIR